MRPILYEPVKSPYLVPFDGSFRMKDARTKPPKDAPDKKQCKEELAKIIFEMAELQQQLYADDRFSLLLVFQAMDAAGKDGTIRAVMSGVNPAGCQVYSFKQPSAEELDHDFFWRIYQRLPERGRIGIFNRSHYEEVLVVRVHPEYLDGQRLPRRPSDKKLFEERYESIRDFEKHLARNGTAIVKFFLNVSQEEQRARFLARLEESEKHWKFSPADMGEAAHWDKYMKAYEEALNETSRAAAPWYAVPAGSKGYMRLAVARIVVDTLKTLPLKWPEVSEKRQAEMVQLRDELRQSVAAAE